MNKARFLTTLTIIGVVLSSGKTYAQREVVEQINSYGTFDRWSTRLVHESGIIGGQDKLLYEFFGNHEVRDTGSTPFSAPEGYLWRTNNVLAVVMGIVKTNNTVFPEARGDGYCARIETHMEHVKAMGMINMSVCCQGALLLGTLPEPIRDTKNPMAKVLYGIPFEGRPESVVFDYKAEVGHAKVKATGLSRVRYLEEKDYPIATLILQKRWQDEDGRIHAKRVGTAVHLFEKDREDWVNGFEMKIHYGDISAEPFFNKYMDLHRTKEFAYHTKNRKGKNVAVIEEGWAEPDEEPNCMVLAFLSSAGEAFIGGIGNTLWIDNVRIVMP